MRWRRRSATECVTASATRRSRKHLARRSLKPSALSAAASRTTPPFEVIAPPSKAPTSLRPPEVPKASSSWLHCVGIGEHLLASRSRCGTTTFAESEPRCSSHVGEIQARRTRLSCDVRHDRHHHSFHAKWMGSGCGISRNGGQPPLPDEGHGSLCPL